MKLMFGLLKICSIFELGMALSHSLIYMGVYSCVTSFAPIYFFPEMGRYKSLKKCNANEGFFPK